MAKYSTIIARYAQRATDDARTTPGAKLVETIASDEYGKKHVETDIP
jgi:hypothetical protein